MYGPELAGAFAEFKRTFDPGNKMNPGKVVGPYRPDQNLQWGTDYRPRHVETYFRFPEDQQGFADAANRCFGIGLCRRLDGGTMCPSFMVTREEIHSTRGRARLLFETMSGLLRDKGGVTRTSRKLSTCASRARAARATAPAGRSWCSPATARLPCSWGLPYLRAA
jgi:hypothetical protein